MIHRSPLSHLVLGSLVLVTLAGRPVAAHEQAPPPATRAVTEIASGVYVIQHPLSGWVESNTVVVIGDRDVLVVDTGFTSASACEDIADIKKWTNKPIRYVVNAHWHEDHTAGNIDYQRAFPGVAIIAHPSTAMMLAKMSPSLASGINRDAPPYKKSIEDRLASGKAANGQPLTDAQRASLNRQLSDIAKVMTQATEYQQAMPTLTIKGQMTVDLGNRVVDITHAGRGNTAGDLVVYLPKERIVATGDLLVSPTPFTFDGYPTEWIQTLKAIRQWPTDITVPGHGNVMRDHDYLDKVVTLMQNVIDQVDAQLIKNPEATFDDVKKAVDLTAMKTLFGATDAYNGGNFDLSIKDHLIEIVFHELKQR